MSYKYIHVQCIPNTCLQHFVLLSTSKNNPTKKTFVAGGGNTPNTNLSFVGWDEYLESTREIDLDVSGWLLVGDNLFLAKTMGVECC